MSGSTCIRRRIEPELLLKCRSRAERVWLVGRHLCNKSLWPAEKDLLPGVRPQDGGGVHGVLARVHRQTQCGGSQFHCSLAPSYTYQYWS